MSRNLINNTITNELNQKKSIETGCRITTESELISLELVGFIPMNQIDFYDITKFIVGINYIRLEFDAWGNKKEHRFFPIAKKIDKLKVNKLIIDDNFISILNLDSASKTSLKLYQQYFGTVNGNIEKSKNNLLKTKEFIFEDENLYYILKENEMSFSRGNKILGISDYFLCLCSYINPITGKLEYVIKQPDELIITLQKNK